MARALRDADFQVIYLGLRRTPAQIVNAAIQEDAAFIGLSILSGAHLPLTEKVLNLLAEKNAADIKVIVGGTIPTRDVAALERLGVARVFPTGSSFDEIVGFIKDQQ